MQHQIRHFKYTFQSVSTNEDISTMPRQNKCSYPAMTRITIDTSCVENVLRKHNAHKATGPDAIPGHLLWEPSAEVAPALLFVFQMSLNIGQIPDNW